MAGMTVLNLPGFVLMMLHRPNVYFWKNIVQQVHSKVQCSGLLKKRGMMVSLWPHH